MIDTLADTQHVLVFIMRHMAPMYFQLDYKCNTSELVEGIKIN